MENMWFSDGIWSAVLDNRQPPRLLYHQSTSSQTIPSQQIQHGVVLFIFVLSQFSFVKFTR